MRKIILLAVLALSLGGCALFESFRNPIQRNQLAEIESGYGLALTAAVGYRDLCDKKIIKRATCAPVVSAMQLADRSAEAALNAADDFVEDNPTLDASSVISAARAALTALQNLQAQNGVTK